MLNMGNATLEIFDERQAEIIDKLEAGRRVRGQVCFALQVPNKKATVEWMLINGALLVHELGIDPVGRLQRPSASPGRDVDDFILGITGI